MNYILSTKFHHDEGVSEIRVIPLHKNRGRRKSLSATKGEHMNRRWGTCPMRVGKIMRKVLAMCIYQHDGREFTWR